MTNPRALRATELAKQFAVMGHDVTVYAALGSYDYTSFQLENNFKVENIGKMYFLLSNSDGTVTANIFKRILHKLFKRGLEFPTIELMPKIPLILKKNSEIDLLITIAAPFTIHWGAAMAKTLSPEKFPKVWLADCGDPYMGNKFEKHYFYFKFIEKWFSRKADYIIVPVEGAIKAYYKEFHSKIRVIPQGFNFDSVPLGKIRSQNNVITFGYAGTFYKDIRDPSLFLEYLCSLDSNFKFILYTKNKNILSPYLNQLKDKMEIRDYVPRKQLLKALSTMDFVVNFENGTDVQSPSKLIDYALINKPILSVNSKILDEENINKFLSKDYSGQLFIDNIDKYNIKNVAREFIKLSETVKD